MTNLSEKGKQQIADWEAEERERKRLNLPLDEEHRTCMSRTRGDCKHLFSALSWWCGNRDAGKYRGTTIPDVYNCPFYEERQFGKKHIPAQVIFLKAVLGFFLILMAIPLFFLLLSLFAFLMR